MRGARAFVTLTVALILVAIFSYILYRMVVAASQFSSSPLSPQVGQTLFAGLAFLELMIVSTITPAITAGAISNEKERQTYEMLMATPLDPVNILWGKLISALGYVVLMVFVAVPMSSLIFIFGGVTTRDILKTFAVLVIITVMFGVIGLSMSALFGRTGRATVASYVMIAALLFGPIFLAVASSALDQSEPPRWLLVPSPISALSSAFSSSVNQQYASNIFWRLGNPVQWIWGSPAISQTEIPRPLYHYSLPLYAVITIVLYLVTTRLVRPSNRWKIQWNEVLIAAIVLIGILGLACLAYLFTTHRYENFLMIAK